jgi:predicted neuraminidase
VPELKFIFQRAPFRQCHASTIVETSRGLVAAWFGGSGEGEPDVRIWLSRHDGRTWSAPYELAPADEEDRGLPAWNPVLVEPRPGFLLLFYKVGPDPASWKGRLRTSEDGGATWSPAQRLPGGFHGPVRSKPVPLAGGILLCPSSSEHKGWRIHFERTSDLGRTWESTGPVPDPQKLGAIQPTILKLQDGTLLALCRSRSGRIAESTSIDRGKTWSPLQKTTLPNPNSAIDAVTLADGRHLLAYNPSDRDRSPLTLSVSADGSDWKAGVILEAGKAEYSYPSVIQASDGMVHVTYTWKRKRIGHVRLDPATLKV